MAADIKSDSLQVNPDYYIVLCGVVIVHQGSDDFLLVFEQCCKIKKNSDGSGMY